MYYKEIGEILHIIEQVHDKLFKETFGSVEIARDFMNGYLPTSIRGIVDLNTLQAQKDSFINQELQEMFSDLLFKVDINNKEGYIYFLFEHKSYKDKLVIFQLLRYMVEIWESKIKKENNNELPIIIPLVIYHDKGQWNIETKLSKMIPGYNDLPKDVKGYIPDYEYLVYDLTKYRDEDIKLESITRIILKIMRDVRYANKDRIIDILAEGFALLDEIIEKDTTAHYIESCLRYILSIRSDIDKDEMIQIANQVSVEGSELVMTIADKLRQEGRQEGREEGRQREITKVVKNAIVKGMEIEDIVDLTGLTKKEIGKIRKEMLQ